MSEPRQQPSKKRTVYAQQPDAIAPRSDSVELPKVISVELAEDEEVEWQWTYTQDGRRIVTGYTIIKKSEPSA